MNPTYLNHNDRFEAERVCLRQVLRAKLGRKTHDLPLLDINPRGSWDYHPRDALYDASFDSREPLHQLYGPWETLEELRSVMAVLAKAHGEANLFMRFSSIPQGLKYEFPDGSGLIDVSPSDDMLARIDAVVAHAANYDSGYAGFVGSDIDPAVAKLDLINHAFDTVLVQIWGAREAIATAGAEYAANGGGLRSTRISAIVEAL